MNTTHDFLMNKLLVVGLVVCLFLVGCGAQELYFCKDGTIGGGQYPADKKIMYFCPDGTQTINPDTCRFEAPVTIKLSDAESRAKSFVDAYVRSDGWTASVINTYREDGNYFSQIVISKRDETPYESIVLVDGTKGIVSCSQNCEYI